MKSTFLFLTLLLSFWGRCSIYDSLYIKINNHKYQDTAKIKFLISYANQLTEKDFEGAKKYYLDAIHLAQKIGHKKLQADALLALAQAFDEEAQHDSAIVYYTQSASIYQSLGLKAEAAFVKNLRGIAYENTVNYTRAFNDYFDALRLYQSINDSKGIANANINIGLIYQYQRNYNLSNYYLNKALSIGKAIQDKNIEMAAFNNLANNFKHTGNYTKALNYYFTVYEYDVQNNDSINISYSLNNIGTVYEELGMYDSAYYYYYNAAAIKSLNKDKVGLGNTLNNIASALIGLRRYKEAKVYLDSAEKLNKQYGYSNNLVQTYYNRYKLFEAKHDYAKALDYFILYKSTEDSIVKLENDRLLEATQQQYELEVLNNKINNQNLIIQEGIRARNINIAIIVVLLIVIGFLFYTYQMRLKLNKKLKQQADAISEQNKQLKQINNDLLLAKEASEKAVKAKMQFLSIMSHEIRTPLNAIHAISNLLAHSTDAQVNQQNIKILKEASDNLVNLVNNVLDLGKLESGKLQLMYAPFNLYNLLQRVIELNKVNAKNLTIELKYDEKLPQSFIGDELRLNQVLSNLISNAIKFTQQGNVSINVIAEKIDKPNYFIRFEVKDTGIGIPKDKQDKIFELFEQADNSTTRKYGGSGLGLTICKYILELYGSELKLESEEGKGSTFYFTLKLKSLGN